MNTTEQLELKPSESTMPTDWYKAAYQQGYDDCREFYQRNFLIKRRKKYYPWRINEVIQAGAEFFKIPAARIVSKKRRPDQVRARMLLMYYIMEHSDYTQTQVGSHFSGRDHSTVVYNAKQFRKLMDVYPEEVQTLTDFTQYINAKLNPARGGQTQQ